MDAISSPVPAPSVDAQAPSISRAIYGMPMFVTLVATDVGRTVSWFVEGLGLLPLFTVPGPAGPVLVHLRRWQFQDLLVRPADGPVAGGSATTSLAAVFGELDDLAERARAHGGGTVEGPADTPWNTRDLTTRDPDGNVVIFTAARPPELQDPAFADSMRRWSAEQGG